MAELLCDISLPEDRRFEFWNWLNRVDRRLSRTSVSFQERHKIIANLANIEELVVLGEQDFDPKLRQKLTWLTSDNLEPAWERAMRALRGSNSVAGRQLAGKGAL